jgi:hypothetical protein
MLQHNDCGHATGGSYSNGTRRHNAEQRPGGTGVSPVHSIFSKGKTEGAFSSVRSE